MIKTSLSRHRNQARILLKDIRKGDPAALERIEFLNSSSPNKDVELTPPVQLKHALDVIALELGFDNWSALKTDFETKVMAEIAAYYVAGHLNHWYANYDEAREHIRKLGGYLLPYQGKGRLQYYICDSGYLNSFGFDPDAKEWKEIGFNLVQPLDKKAWLTLLDAWVEAKR